MVDKRGGYVINKKAVLSQGNRAMPQPAVLFGLKFADMTTFTTSLRVAKLRKPGFRAPNIPAARKTEFNAKWPFKVIPGHVFWSQWNWKGDQGLILNTNAGLIC